MNCMSIVAASLHRRVGQLVCLAIPMSILLAPAAILAAQWKSLPSPFGRMWTPDDTNWRSYRGATLERVPDGLDGQSVLRVTVADDEMGGFSLTATPRGGMGNRVRIRITYRVVSGSPVSVYVGPNTLNQLAGVLASREWETATVEVGLLSDFHLVIHAIQRAPDGIFEVAELKVEAQTPRKPLSPSRLGVVDVVMDSYSASDPALAMRRSGSQSLQVERTQEVGVAGSCYRITAAQGSSGQAGLFQGLGHLPAGSQITVQIRGRVTAGSRAIFGLRFGNEILAREAITATKWTPFELSHMLHRDGPIVLFVEPISDGPMEFWVPDLSAWVELPDPLAPAVVPQNKAGGPISFAVKDAKSIRITPPWPDVPPLLCHLEYNSRWGFRFPTSHELNLSETRNEMTLVWHFENDPVTYSVLMKADRPNSILLEVRLHNAGEKAVPQFSPGFCLQLMGAYSPKTFAYTIIPRDEKPFPLTMGRYFVTRPPMWSNVGWVNADYTGSLAYSKRVKLGDDFKPPNQKWIQQCGDFPLLARRLPGRDAWIAWLWPNAARYFGNTQSPCMHMDPILGKCSAGESLSMFGRMIFFEGTWDQLFELAQQEKAELDDRG